MADIKGSKTEENLKAAFAGESMARNKYTYFASKARKDGYEQIAAIFEETAENEREHAKLWYKLLNGGIDTTADNLKSAVEGENYEWTDMYPGFLKDAEAEQDKIAVSTFKKALDAEKIHEQLYREMKATLDKGEVFDYYLCPVCGYIEKGSAPERCPICGAPRERFEKF